MPPKAKVIKKDIVDAALSIVREKGVSELNARKVAAMLCCSTQPIFSNYRSMAELRVDVIFAAQDIYRAFLQKAMSNPALPAYKSSGMAYIRFAKEEGELFRLLFMRDRRGEDLGESRDDIAEFVSLLMNKNGFDENQARTFHIHMWVFVHGIATMIATNYIPWDEDTISGMLSNEYKSFLSYYQKQENGGKPT